MTTIADEETEHAAFSADLHAWAAGHFSADEVERLDRARQTALAHLHHDLKTENVPADLQVIAGHPSRMEGVALFEGLF